MGDPPGEAVRVADFLATHLAAFDDHALTTSGSNMS